MSDKLCDSPILQCLLACEGFQRVEQWESNNNEKVPGSNPADALGLTLEPNLVMRV